MPPARNLRWVACLLPLALLGASGCSRLRSTAGPRRFAADFYQWYAHANGQDPFQARAAAFDPALIAAWKRLLAAQARCKELLSPDFDPLLNAPEADPAGYEVGAVTRDGDRFRAAIASRGGPGPSLYAEIAHQNGRWVFTDFYYPGRADTPDLLSLLRDVPTCANPR